jgi:hypothetical protein
MRGEIVSEPAKAVWMTKTIQPWTNCCIWSYIAIGLAKAGTFPGNLRGA